MTTQYQCIPSLVLFNINKEGKISPSGINRDEQGNTALIRYNNLQVQKKIGELITISALNVQRGFHEEATSILEKEIVDSLLAAELPELLVPTNKPILLGYQFSNHIAASQQPDEIECQFYQLK